MSSKYKVLNQINNIVGKVLEENEELLAKISTYNNATTAEVTQEAGVVHVPLIDYVANILAREVDGVYNNWDFKLVYDEDGINKTFQEYSDYHFEKWYTAKKMYKQLGFETAKQFIEPFMKPFYENRLNELKMEYVRSHKEGK
ncbi:hypothetical protein G7062_00010 [Erysipelothrix sp. HDW6C]|uniref:hypothetical protein n=1 Tax=Erysipelothrix sp. HDW6C TaxID=2714930 RepID=UPI00140AA19F|nr:hypothetical protein [Erysipelothrix sp. HDW6C]QIK68759.1 hypothetical protein G7062_00010 [Erysipelothrix sp. HDW6C]